MAFQITIYYDYGEISSFKFKNLTLTLLEWITSYFNLSDKEDGFKNFREYIDIRFLIALQEYLLLELKTPITTNRWFEFTQIGEWLYLINWILTLPLENSDIFLTFN